MAAPSVVGAAATLTEYKSVPDHPPDPAGWIYNLQVPVATGDLASGTAANDMLLFIAVYVGPSGGSIAVPSGVPSGVVSKLQGPSEASVEVTASFAGSWRMGMKLFACPRSSFAGGTFTWTAPTVPYFASGYVGIEHWLSITPVTLRGLTVFQWAYNNIPDTGTQYGNIGASSAFPGPTPSEWGQEIQPQVDPSLVIVPFATGYDSGSSAASIDAANGFTSVFDRVITPGTDNVQLSLATRTTDTPFVSYSLPTWDTVATTQWIQMAVAGHTPAVARRRGHLGLRR